MTMSRVGEVIGITATRHQANLASIESSYDRLAELLEDGTISDRQFQWVLDREPPDDAADLVVDLWARQLRRWLKDPKAIGINEEWGKTYPCSCGPGDGWTFADVVDADGSRHTLAKPCQRCNPRQYQRWLDHWSDPDHTCADCTGPARRRGPNDELHARQDEHARVREEADDAILFGLQ